MKGSAGRDQRHTDREAGWSIRRELYRRQWPPDLQDGARILMALGVFDRDPRKLAQSEH